MAAGDRIYVNTFPKNAGETTVSGWEYMVARGTTDVIRTVHAANTDHVFNVNTLSALIYIVAGGGGSGASTSGYDSNRAYAGGAGGGGGAVEALIPASYFRDIRDGTLGVAHLTWALIVGNGGSKGAATSGSTGLSGNQSKFGHVRVYGGGGGGTSSTTTRIERVGAGGGAAGPNATALTDRDVVIILQSSDGSDGEASLASRLQYDSMYAGSGGVPGLGGIEAYAKPGYFNTAANLTIARSGSALEPRPGQGAAGWAKTGSTGLSGVDGQDGTVIVVETIRV